MATAQAIPEVRHNGCPANATVPTNCNLKIFSLIANSLPADPRLSIGQGFERWLSVKSGQICPIGLPALRDESFRKVMKKPLAGGWL